MASNGNTSFMQFTKKMFAGEICDLLRQSTQNLAYGKNIYNEKSFENHWFNFCWI